MANITRIPSTNVSLVDENGNISRDWYRFWSNLFVICGSGINIPQLSNYVVLPNVTTAQKTAISNPVLGQMVFDTTLDRACVYQSTGWRTIA